MKFSCRKCKQELDADDEYAGEQVTCPNCSALITIPTLNTRYTECPRCGGADCKKVSFVYESQTRTMTLGGLSMGTDGSLGGMVGDLTSSSLLAQRIAPPAKPSPLLAVLLGVFAFFAFVVGILGVSDGKMVPGDLLVWAFGIGIFLTVLTIVTVIAHAFSVSKWEASFAAWSRQTICLSCGHTWA